MESTYSALEDLSRSRYRHKDLSITDTLSGFERLRITALTNAAEISPQVRKVTIGPNSPIKKEIRTELTPVKNDITIIEDLTEDKLREDLRYTLIMKEYENRLQESSEGHFKNLVERMIAKRAESMSKFWNKQSEECKRRALEVRTRKLQMLKELQENDNVSVLERALLDKQKSQMINSQTIENMNRILEEENKATAQFASITDSQTKICICYNKITDLLNIEPLAKTVCDKYLMAINTVMGNLSIILDIYKTGNVSDKEVKQAEILSVHIDNITSKIINEVNEIKQQETLKKQEEESLLREKELKEKEAQKHEEEVKAAEIANAQKAATASVKQWKPTFYSAMNYKYYKELQLYLEAYEAQYKELLENPNLKKFRFDCQKAVNTPINALSSVSGEHMKDKFEKLFKLLNGEQVQVLDTYVTATQYPQGLDYCTALLAKKIVRQGDLLVSSNPEAAFPLAAVTIALWVHFPKFGVLLEAYFHRQCPYLVPMFLPQKEGQTDKEFYMSRGYTYNEEGMVEKQDKFLKRMSGIFRLRCAIWIAKMPSFINAPNPHGLRYGWQWLASFINLKPEPDICATLLHDFFTVCGSEFIKYYRKQFTKIMELINTDYLAILQNIDEGGPKTRLEVFLLNVLRTGYIPPPSGLLQPNIW